MSLIDYKYHFRISTRAEPRFPKLNYAIKAVNGSMAGRWGVLRATVNVHREHGTHKRKLLLLVKYSKYARGICEAGTGFNSVTQQDGSTFRTKKDCHIMWGRA